jgi:superfamily II DNA or RNA helicase
MFIDMRLMLQLRPHQQVALDALAENNKGVCVFPTGGGKTNVGIFDAMEQFKSDAPKTIVVVAPRILLAEQLSASEYLEFITNVAVMHVHSGETHHYSLPNLLIFTTGLSCLRVTTYLHHLQFSTATSTCRH